MFPVPHNEAERLEALRGLQIVGTPPEAHFDAICRTAAALFATPIVLVSLMEAESQWFKAKCGLAVDGTGRDVAFCNYALLSDDVTVVGDASSDARFAENPLVAGEPGIRFYAGAPLLLEPGIRVGTLCVIDTVPRSFSAEQCRQLQDLALVVVAHLRLHAANARHRGEIAARLEHEAVIADQARLLEARETSLNETNRLLLMAEQMAHVGHWRLDLSNGSRTWSDEMFRIFGLDPSVGAPSPEDAIRRYHPDDRDRVQGVVAAAAMQGRDFACETRLVRPDGELRDVVLRGSYEPSRIGAGATFSGVIIDVTDLHRTQARLRESEGRFRLLIEGITDCAICLLDPDGTVTNWHAGAQRIHGYTAGEFVGRHFSEFYTRADRDSGRPEATLAAAFANGRSETEGWRLRKDGSAFWASVVIQPIHDGDEALIGFAKMTRDVTERRQAAEALRLSEARYRLLADNTTDMITHLDLDGRRLYVSPASQDLLGYEPEALIGTRPSDAIHPDDLPTFRGLVADLREGKRTRAISLNRLRHRDGRWIWVEASMQLLRGEDGAPSGFLTSVRNVADRHRAEEAMRESETRYRTLADALPQMVWIVDRKTRATTYANRRFEDYCGQIGASYRDRLGRFDPADVERIEDAWRAGEATEQPQEAEARLIRQDGISRWHKVMLVPIRHGGAVTSWLGTALDIHDLVTAQQALLESTDLLRIAQEAAGAGTWDVDITTGAVILSPESAAMHGLPGTEPAAMTTEAWNKLAHPDDAPRVWAEVQRALHAREMYSAEFRIVLPEGKVRWVHGIGRAYFDAHGQAIRMTGLNFDVDKRKRVEAALVEAGAAAEIARSEAEKASAAKTDFLAAMSHEIRTPLNSILGYTELLLGEAHHGAEDRYKLTRILGSGHALLTIVNDVLDFSKIEAGRIELEPQAFALGGLVADTMSMIRGLAIDKPLSLRAEIDPQLPPYVVGDPNRLRQVLLNLMNNAVKFTREGEVVLTIVQEERADEAVHLRCAVRDTGIGIPADKRGLLFQRFSQVDGSIARRFGGTGLGLAISKSLIDLMGGEIGVESRDGAGSTFWFTLALPLAEAPRVLADPPLAVAARPARVLLVEDVAMNQEIAKAVLASVGHQVDLASDGAEAVQAVQCATYDVVLMDVQMPVMDGLEATQRIRNLGGRYADLPIVALTANVLAEQVSRFRRAGMVDHVGKPFRKDELLAAVAHWSARGRAVEAARGGLPETVDEAAFAELKELLGRETLVRLLHDLEAVLKGPFALALAKEEGAPQLAATAHTLVSSAGMLGFTALSQACRDLEAAYLAGGVAVAERAVAEEAGRRALHAIAGLIRDLATPDESGQALRRTAS